MESIYKLGILMSVVDRVTGPGTKIGGTLDGLKGKAAALGPVFDKFKSYGLIVGTAGAFMLHALTGAAMATVGTQAALGELVSVGVADMAALEAAGQQFSNQWSGTDKAAFIGAAYDIKSGISSLTDTGVAEFTKLAALTGKATKSTTAEMTSLFATGYGIYKGAYGQLNDLQFGELFSAGIAASVQSFKTTGSGMAQAISTLGATATSAKVPLEEQLSILGMLQATMTGSEAGTKYKAMMNAAAGAGQKLNLQFLDANKQLLSMPDILTELQSKYGSTLDAVEKMEIQKAFGTQEAVAVIDLFYDKVDGLSDNIAGLGKAMQLGTSFTERMAAAMNQDIGAGVGLLGQQWHNLVETIGKQLIPILVPLFAWIGRLIVSVQQFADRWPVLTRVAVVTVAILSTMLFVLGGLAAALGVAGLLFPQIAVGMAAISSGLAIVKTAFLGASTAAWRFTAALLANPITWIVIAVVALVAALIWVYNEFETVRNAVDAFLYAIGYVAGVVIRFGGIILSYLLNPLSLIRDAFNLVTNFLSSINLYESGRKILGSLINGIRSMLGAPAELIFSAFTKIRNLLPFSDAKEGPLSSLTLSGARIMETLGAGVTNAAPGLQKAVAASLVGVSLAATVGVTPVNAGERQTAAQTSAAISKPNVQKSGKTVTIQHLSVQLPGVSDADSFIKQLQALVEGQDD